MAQSSQILQHLNPEILNLAQTSDNFIETLSRPDIFCQDKQKGLLLMEAALFIVVLLNQ